jgi:hypothetical protein
MAEYAKEASLIGPHLYLPNKSMQQYDDDEGYDEGLDDYGGGDDGPVF